MVHDWLGKECCAALDKQIAAARARHGLDISFESCDEPETVPGYGTAQRRARLMVRKHQRWEEMDKSGTAIEELFDSYALYNRSEGRAASTIAWYAEKLRGFHRWLEGHGHPTDLAGFRADRVREFALHLQKRDKKFERNPFRLYPDAQSIRELTPRGRLHRPEPAPALPPAEGSTGRAGVARPRGNRTAAQRLRP